MNESQNPIEIYKAIIDEQVKNTASIASKLILREGIYSRKLNSEIYNNFVSNLSDEQRKLVAEMIQNERQSAIHDVLTSLSWWNECEEVTLIYKDQKLPNSLSEQGMHGDYIGRLTDWEWPY